MRKCVLAGLALLLFHCSSGQQFDFSPWTSGAVSGSLLNGTCRVDVSVSGSSFINSSPRYNNGLIGAGKGNGLVLDHNWLNTTTSTTVTFTFTPAISNPIFKIEDINRNNPCAAFCSSAWTDRVVVTVPSGRTINAVREAPAEQTLSGNGTSSVTLTGNSVCNGINGRVDFSITGTISTLLITYTSGPSVDRTTWSGGSPNTCGAIGGETNCNSSRGACPDPARQYITIGGIIAGCSLLPVELTGFSAECKADGVELQWATASEVNNSHFEAERSGDAVSWETIGRVKGRGNSNFPVNYQFTDEEIIPGPLYYRLKQVDLDGSLSYSPVIYKDCTAPGKPYIRVFPNPAAQQAYIQFLPPENSETIRYELYDPVGRKIIAKSAEAWSRSAENLLPLDLSALPKGMYFIRIYFDSDLHYTSRILVK